MTAGGAPTRSGADAFRLAARCAFVLYALALAAATHWPQEKLPGIDVQISDKVIHFALFAGWGGLLGACAWFGPMRSRTNAVAVAMIGVVYAIVDEWTQMIPGLNRSASVGDAIANVAGVLAGATLSWAAGVWLGR